MCVFWRNPFISMKKHNFLRANPAFVMRGINFFCEGLLAYVMKGIHFLLVESKGNPPKRRKMLKHNY